MEKTINAINNGKGITDKQIVVYGIIYIIVWVGFCLFTYLITQF
jgi:hypothetical protein